MKEKKRNSFELIAIHFEKELKSILKDKGALLILVGAMLLYPLIYSVGYYNETLTNLPVAIVDLDQTVASRKYTGMLDASSELAVSCNPTDLNEAEKLFYANEISGVILIPNGFQKDVLSGKQANVAVYADGSYFLKYKTQYLAASYVNAYFSGGIAVKRYMAEGRSFEQAQVCNNPLDAQTHTLYNPSSSYGSFVMPGLIIIIIQQTLLIGIGILGGSFSESKVSPFVLPDYKRQKEIFPLLLGRLGTYLLISVFNISLAVILVHQWFSYPDKGNILDVVMLLLPFLIAVIFLGIGLSTLFRHRESAIVFMMFLSPIALFMSGVSWPVSAMPEWIVGLSKVLPGSTVVPAYLRIRTMGVGLSDVKPELLFLYKQAGIYATLTFGYFFIRVFLDKRKSRSFKK